jgi:hypothetical protein
VVLVAITTAAVTALLVNIFDRMQEARDRFFEVVQVTEDTEDPAIWGKNFPMHRLPRCRHHAAPRDASRLSRRDACLQAFSGVADYDVNTMASRQEMRSFACGQSHVEYYFKGPEKRLTYFWTKGLRVDQIADY